MEEDPIVPEAVVPMAFRNPVVVSADSRVIDIEAEHPRLGWIPLTITEAEYPEIWAQVTLTPVTPYAPEDPAIALERERLGMICSRFQAKAALMMAGHLPAVEAALAEADAITKMAWTEAVEFRRMSPTILGIGGLLGMSETEIDDLFRNAILIQA